MTKTITDQDIFKFADASGDYNPLHIDDVYARSSRYGRCVAHPILTAGIISAVLSSEIPGLGTIFEQLEIRFLRPVYINDRITATAMVQEIIDPEQVRMLVACVNQNGEDVALGNAIVIPPKETRVIGKVAEG
ncbi:MAG: MaoC family dehydratase [Phycisphaerae bacterium]